METYNIAKRELLWDMFLADKVENISLNMHKPIRKNVALECDEAWEGKLCGQASLLFDGEKYRIYYRGQNEDCGDNFETLADPIAISVAYSYDGKTFFKPNIGLYKYKGSKDNNIIFMDDRTIDNFTVYLDSNPECTPDAKFKAISEYDVYEDVDGEKQLFRKLAYYKSADGIHFEFVCILPVKGNFDSVNIILWNDKTQKYHLYFRKLHKPNPEYRIEFESEYSVRDINVAFSDDFETWSEPHALNYGEDDKWEIQMYTNGIRKYPDTDMFYGLPTRYVQRSIDAVNYKYLPDINGTRQSLIEKYGRGGTAVTEAMLMTSRDGINFKRIKEAFMTPGIENGDNWAYGDGYFVYGFAETESDFKGEPKEISLYMGTGYRARPVTFERFTLRKDGFLSWHANFEGGEILTKPITFDGENLSVNFATSVLGYLIIDICDESGNEIDGYSSGRLFGNSLDRPVEFEKSLKALNGKNLRLRIKMKDCDFYSFIFD